MPDRDDYYDRREFYRQQDRSYEHFRDDMEYARRKRETEVEQGWEAFRHGDTLGAIRGLGGVDAALEYADALQSARNESAGGYSLASLQFYEGGLAEKSFVNPGFNTVFEQNTTRCVYVLPVFHNPWEFVEAEVTVSAQVGLFGEPESTRLDNAFTIYPEWRKFQCYFCYGWDEPGNWTPGLYQTKIFIDNEQVCERVFVIHKANAS